MVVNSIMKFTILYTLMVCFTQGISQNTPSNVVTEITTTNPVVSNDPPVITKVRNIFFCKMIFLTKLGFFDKITNLARCRFIICMFVKMVTHLLTYFVK